MSQFSIVNIVNNKKEYWKQFAKEHGDKMEENPFANWDGCRQKKALDKSDPNYGRPVEGTLTARRGKKALKHVSKEIVELCRVIAVHGWQEMDGTYKVKFGVLFSAYEKISNKLVGMLVRARKHKLLDFEGEMLYQGQDEASIITLYEMPECDEPENNTKENGATQTESEGSNSKNVQLHLCSFKV